MSRITEGTLKELYEQAKALRRMAPWQWMYDTDLFGVRNPDTGEVGYCCIMGRGGEFLGLAVYRGRAGLASYEKLQEINQDGPMLPANPAFEQDCLMVSFNARQDIHEQEHERIRSLGLRFRGPTHWPSFSDYSPGMFPWPIQTEAQGRFLLVAMQQAMEVATLCRQDQDLLDHVEDSAPCLLVREQEGGNWQDQWLPMTTYEPDLPAVITHSLFLRSNLGSLASANSEWAVDLFYFPNPVQETPQQRPYLPLMLLVADLSTGLILGHTAYQPGEITEKLEGDFVNICKEAGELPHRMVMPSLEVMGYFKPFAQELDLKLEVNPQLKFLEEIKGSLFGSMSL